MLVIIGHSGGNNLIPGAIQRPSRRGSPDKGVHKWPTERAERKVGRVAGSGVAVKAAAASRVAAGEVSRVVVVEARRAVRAVPVVGSRGVVVEARRAAKAVRVVGSRVVAVGREGTAEAEAAA